MKSTNQVKKSLPNTGRADFVKIVFHERRREFTVFTASCDKALDKFHTADTIQHVLENKPSSTAAAAAV